MGRSRVRRRGGWPRICLITTSSGARWREADVGAGGIGPFLVGYDSGIEWRILSALNDIEMWLMVKDGKYRSLKDFRSGDKIAVVPPDSIQAIILRKAAEEQLGDPRALG